MKTYYNVWIADKKDLTEAIVLAENPQQAEQIYRTLQEIPKEIKLSLEPVTPSKT